MMRTESDVAREHLRAWIGDGHDGPTQGKRRKASEVAERLLQEVPSVADCEYVLLQFVEEYNRGYGIGIQTSELSVSICIGCGTPVSTRSMWVCTDVDCLDKVASPDLLCLACGHGRRDHDHDGECCARPDNLSPTDEGFCACHAFVLRCALPPSDDGAARTILIQRIGEIAADRNQLRTALSASIDGANALRAKLATALETQAACIGHAADIIVYRKTLQSALRLISGIANQYGVHFAISDEIRSALARGEPR